MNPSAALTSANDWRFAVFGRLFRAGGGAVNLVTFLSGDSFTRGPAGGGEPLPVAPSGSSAGDGGSSGPSGRTKSGTAEVRCFLSLGFKELRNKVSQVKELGCGEMKSMAHGLQCPGSVASSVSALAKTPCLKW